MSRAELGSVGWRGGGRGVEWYRAIRGGEEWGETGWSMLEVAGAVSLSAPMRRGRPSSVHHRNRHNFRRLPSTELRNHGRRGWTPSGVLTVE